MGRTTYCLEKTATAAIAGMTLLVTTAAPSHAQGLPEAPPGLVEGNRGEDYQQDNDLPPVLSEQDIRDIRGQQQRERSLQRYEEYINRLEDLGVGQNGGGGGSGSSGSSSSSSSSSSSASTNIAHDGGGATEAVKGAGEHGIPENAGIGAPNPVAFAAVQEAANISASGPYPYAWGGSSPEESFDCSGFTGWVYGEAGLRIPNVAQSQDKVASDPEAGGFSRGDGGTSESVMVIEKKEDLLPGDLLVWKGGEAGGHVGIILTVGGEGEAAFQESGDPNSMGPYRTENSSGQSFMMVRPTVKEDGSPVIPEAKPFPKEGDSGDSSEESDDSNDSETPTDDSEEETATRPEDEDSE